MQKILIIEDDQSIAEIERDYLEMNGFEVSIETDGLQGYHRALQERFDLILLDVMLPHMDGFEICKKLRQSQDICILLVTAKQEEIDKIRGLGLGADDFITKPFRLGELVARVKAHLARFERLSGGKRQRQQLQLGELVIDPDARSVEVAGEEVMLTTKEFDLLYFLASHPNHVFSKQHLFEALWGIDSIGDVATVVVHIRKIREKIEQHRTSKRYIETVWGAGYRFRV